MAKAMTKSQILKALADATDLPKTKMVEVLEALAALAYQEAPNGFTIPGLGKLMLVNCKARVGRNPQTGEPIHIPAKTALKFRIAKAAKDAVEVEEIDEDAFEWQCPHCGTLLTCSYEDRNELMKCCECNGLSRPTDCAQPANSVNLEPTIGHLAHQHRTNREIRLMLLEFRSKIRHLFDSELRELLQVFMSLEAQAAETPARQFAKLLADTTEIEMESRFRESAWQKTKRATLRAATAARDWLQTEDGKTVGAGVLILAAFLGIDLLTDDS
ncbi:MAG: HU family DNA-binding protein [Phycisphaerae bacterium]|nr:HU family DNA-binding protein [Phycisphaerae bacterium]